MLVNNVVYMQIIAKAHYKGEICTFAFKRIPVVDMTKLFVSPGPIIKSTCLKLNYMFVNNNTHSQLIFHVPLCISNTLTGMYLKLHKPSFLPRKVLKEMGKVVCMMLLLYHYLGL